MIKIILKKTLRPLKLALLRTRWGDISTCKKRIQSANNKGIHKRIPSSFVSYKKNRVHQFSFLFERTKIDLSPNKRFQFWIDEDLHFINHGPLNDALSPDFSIILTSSIDDLLKQYENVSSTVAIANHQILLSVKEYIERVIHEMSLPAYEKTRKSFKNMISSSTSSLEDALQRILFWSSLFWQSVLCA